MTETSSTPATGDDVRAIPQDVQLALDNLSKARWLAQALDMALRQYPPSSEELPIRELTDTVIQRVIEAAEEVDSAVEAWA